MDTKSVRFSGLIPTKEKVACGERGVVKFPVLRWPSGVVGVARCALNRGGIAA